MRREIFIDDFSNEFGRPRRGRRNLYGRGEGFYRYDKGRGLHLYGGRRDGLGPHLEEGCNTEERSYANPRVYKQTIYGTPEISKTKMFSNKKDLAEYVDKAGETGQKVDIFKIEDDLYKVVVYKNYQVEE